MRIYDELPVPLRHWLSEAALPWSPVSARRIWKKAQKQGLSVQETLSTLTRAEQRTLAKDKYATQQDKHSDQ